MKSFLEILADEILAKYGDKLSQICIVFPSRRAGIFFKKILSGKIEKALWSPAVLGVQDFIAQLSPFTIAEKLALIFELYESYKTIAAEETFDKFYPWGEMMLNDFDEIDKNLVEADYLFRVLKEHKEVQQQFDFSPADSDDFFRFWRTFSNRELSDYQKDFIKTWEVMGKVYHSFRKKLIAANICYEGMAYRKIYELARTNKLDLKWEKIIFAGFNELNKAEEGIIRELVKQGIMDLYWDADNYYIKNRVMEAGKFLRQNFASLNVNDALWISDELAKSKKEIKIVGASLKAGQAKALGYLLEETGNASENTAVVLPDESLLMPVLHSIPEEIVSLNVTMGFPFRNSVLYNLITGLKNLQKNKKGEGDKTFFYHKNCIQILSHPYIKLINAGKCFKIINEINRRNIIYINRERILQFAEEDEKIFRLIFTKASDSSNIIIYLFEIITEISSVIEGKAPYSQRFEKEFFFALYDGLSHLKNLILKYETAMESDTFWNLIIEILSHIRIPFTGEPLKGLQVMGLLETRSIDFENVYILSMNEGTVPKAASKGSFIPYHLRKAFKMPTFEDEDASIAYYFYRLLQKAKNVTLIYNTETVGVQPGEKSRYILQLKNELGPVNKAITFDEFIFQPGVGTFPEKNIKVNKTPEMIDLLAGREFSPSAISQYINCPLKFYFNRVARLRKENSVEEVLSGAAFGSLLHEIMKQLYIVKKNKIMTKKDLQEIKKAMENDFDKIWKNACSQIDDLREFSEGLYGKNLLFKNIIKKLVKLILDNDVHEVPFNIIEIEGALTGEIQTEVNGNSYKIKLRGILDRVEEKNGITKIIDYKTGKFKKQELKGSVDEFFNDAFTDSKNKETFQQYFYAMLFNDKFPSAKLNIGIYPLRTIGKGIEFYENNGTVPPEKIEEFRKKLKALFSEILDLNVPFKQTDDPEDCKFCDFIPICYRE